MDINQRVKTIVAEQLGISSQKIKDDDCIVSTYNADSIDTTELTMTFEKEFKIQIEDNEIANFTKIYKIVKLIEDKTVS